MATTASTSGTRGASGTTDGLRRLVIVESPAKAKKIAGYLGAGYVVESSIGHIRDLPRNAADVPASHKGQSWARLGVDVDNGFEPLYVVSPDKRDQVRKLKALLKDSDELLLATDEDREGEAIAWHLLEALKPTVPVKRMVFHEITPTAIQHAVENTRELDNNLVDAQETRRILDRLYGYEVSPVLWKKVMPKLSAGRVQSVATRVLVEREQARMAFRSGTYADLEATLLGGAGDDRAQFTATSISVGGQRLATGRDFDPDTGGLKDSSSAVLLLSPERAASLAEGLQHEATVTVSSVEEKPYRRSPAAPFMTSTLQQEGGRKLRLSAQQVMRTAQRLYENGHITYMRTDSTTLSETALQAARSQVRDIYGGEYLPDKARTYARKVKNAQEAHEAIRPSGDAFALPGQLRGELSGEEYRLYELIWQRTVASQMVDARGQSVSLRLTTQVPAGPEQGTALELAASGRTITFPGFLRAYVESTDDGEDDSSESRLPNLATGDVVDLVGVTPETHSTQPPARFTEASLVKRLEELGIGRPSTYASIIETVQARGYVYKKGTALVPTWVAFAVIKLLTDHYARLVDYQFTASMEDDLDHIANGDTQRIEWLSRFYFGGAGGSEHGIGASGGLKKMVTENLGDIDAREVNRIVLGLDDTGAEIAVRVGRYGPYLERVNVEGGDRANVPEDLAPADLTTAMAIELLATPQEGRTLGVDPVTGHEILAKAGRFGPYVTEMLPEDSKDKPRTGSLLSDMSLESIGLDEALRLLSLPRTLGELEGEPVTVQNGRYGPYVKKASDSRTLPGGEAQLFTFTLDEAKALFDQPKQRGRAAAAPPLKEFEPDPVSGEKVLLKEGRFGPYVTDGTVNASLRKDDDPETVTPERVYELLADKRAKGPAPKKVRAKKAPTKKKATAKTTGAKTMTARTTAAKKTAAKKTTAKKAPAKKTGVGTATKSATVPEPESSSTSS